MKRQPSANTKIFRFLVPVKGKSHIPTQMIETILEKVVLPLKDAMDISYYKEYLRHRPVKCHCFELKGRLRHEMYLKVIYPPRMKALLGKDYTYKLTIHPNRNYNPEDPEANVRTFVLCVSRVPQKKGAHRALSF
jgi:hypothetical protein